MNTLAWALIVVSLALLGMTCWNFWLQRKLQEEREENAELCRRDQVQAYNELERGMDEQQESYEQEYLTWEEKESDLQQTVATYSGIVRVYADKLNRIGDVLSDEGGRKNTP